MTWQQVYKQWQEFPELDLFVKDNLNHYKNNEAELEDAFYAPLEFGTAGMRGIIGAGINRMNIYTVRQATEGLAQLIIQKGEKAKKRGVAIAYDSRHQSPEFAMEAAKVLACRDIQAYVFESLRPTPELSFAVRHFDCVAGIMITASHNPAAYNGYKVYGEDGGQMPPKDADALTELVRKVANPLTVETVENEHHPLIQIIGEKVDQAYLEEMKAVTLDHSLIETYGKELKLVFTPLHGTGKMLGERALKQAGFEQFVLVPEQAIPDPNFTTVKSPNPEEYSAFEYAIALGKEEQADLLIATDPDADRLGAAVRLPDGEYQVLTGNQLAALMLDYILNYLETTNQMPKNSAVVKSIVSSELATAICDKHQVSMFNVLTGFKFIAEKIKEFETSQTHHFLFGFEESYGYLVQPFVRDKDAIQALILLAEVAAYYKKQGLTLYDGLQRIFKEYGFHKEVTIPITMSGIEGVAKIKQIMKETREKELTEFGGEKVILTEDFLSQQGKDYITNQEHRLELPSANVLKYHLEDGSWVAIRPSGTEPKIKFYMGVKAENQAEATKKIDCIKATINQLTAD
ncbi:phospho-sugar mutase [Vagococcus humatus]|uniref:Phosphoglucomutase n=1 Tax=Vagococcus humatus TaxID=1889241 RepID=A0A429Z798_9ENTE|nr:phospho-sugar mutase [Vagococcus humatus]RST89553.1 phosphoglucomutase [Vagococcus humatus]